MYPQLFNQASRLAPLLSRVLSRGGAFATPFWKASQIDVPDVAAMPLPPTRPISGPSVPISTDNSGPSSSYSAGSAPVDRILQGHGMFNQSSPMDTMQWPFGPVGAPSASLASVPTQPASVPMPQARPAEAPQAIPDTSFFMRNALQMQDPNGGGYIDPTGAASVRGPDLIAKMMSYLHNKVS